jgi:hypothetical protein
LRGTLNQMPPSSFLVAGLAEIAPSPSPQSSMLRHILVKLHQIMLRSLDE